VNVGRWLSGRAELHPERTALICEDGPDGASRVSYAELERLAERSAAALLAAGVRVGDRVAMALGNEPLTLALYFGAARIGAILIPLNTRLTSPELAFQISDAGAGVVVASDGSEVPAPEHGVRFAASQFIAQLPSDPEPTPTAPGGEAPQTLMYTSGTTGLPKGAVLPHRKTLYNTLNAELYFGLRETDIVCVPVPLFHSFGLKILSVPSLFAGATVLLPARFDPSGLQASIARNRATLLGAVPVMYQRMVRAGLEREKLASLRLAFGAGAPLDAESVRALHEIGIPLVQGYGQTETSILCAMNARDALRKVGSVGRPVRYGEVRVGDPSGAELPRGQSGEVLVRGPIVMLGYWQRPEETEASRIAGWHRTGDLGVLDEEGYLTLVGRVKELYISGGENVYPAEVERVLEAHPGVAEVAVVGVPDPEWGEAGRAYVVPLGEPFDAEAVRAWLAERLARYKLPREFVVVRELPRTASGKVQKHSLAGLAG
jgi:acyl-CoA synthetase (AMP-forming)/AMP-acid ligase II